MEFLQIGPVIYQNVDVMWTFILVCTRFSAMMYLLPGIGGGKMGMRVRAAGILVMSYTSVVAGQIAEIPNGWSLVILAIFAEYLFGMLLGMIPTLIIGGVQMAGQLSATTMGLGAGQLMDPNLGVNVTSLAKVFGDLVVLMFLFLGGHYVIIHAAAGLGGEIVPGTFLMDGNAVAWLTETSAHMFKIGVMVSAPVIVALLLTQFVMGLITKAVPTVNIFIVSFPLTIGIGLVLSALSLPEIMIYIEEEFRTIEQSIFIVSQSTTRGS